MLIVHMPLHENIACVVMIDNHWRIRILRKKESETVYVYVCVMIQNDLVLRKQYILRM